MKKKVDFFIVGAPKCGTTALALQLEQNPMIDVSDHKEPHYFSSDLDATHIKLKTDDEYFDIFFPPEKVDGHLWGDASVWYMYSDVALERVAQHNPDARIVAMIRNPARAAYSLHQQMIFQGQEDITDFRVAWEKSGARFSRTDFPRKMTMDPKLIAYKQAFSFHGQLKRIRRYFPEEQTLIMKQEELNALGVAGVKKVSSFIGAVPFEYRRETTNETFYMKSPLFVNLLRSRLAKQTALTVKGLLGVKTLGIGRPSEPFKAEYEEMVLSDLAEDIAAVKADFGIDLAPQSKAAA